MHQNQPTTAQPGKPGRPWCGQSICPADRIASHGSTRGMRNAPCTEWCMRGSTTHAARLPISHAAVPAGVARPSWHDPAMCLQLHALTCRLQPKNPCMHACMVDLSCLCAYATCSNRGLNEGPSLGPNTRTEGMHQPHALGAIRSMAYRGYGRHACHECVCVRVACAV